MIATFHSLRRSLAVVTCVAMLTLGAGAVAAQTEDELSGPAINAAEQPTAEQPADQPPADQPSPPADGGDEPATEPAGGDVPPLDAPPSGGAPLEGAADQPLPGDAGSPAMAAAPKAEAAQPGLAWYWLALIVVAVFIVPFWLGKVIADRVRMADYGWKIGVVLCSLTAAVVIDGFGWPPKLGPDLSGGINLIYEVDPETLKRLEADGQTLDMNKLIAALVRRINPAGVKEVTIRPAGPGQVEIIIPKADDAEVALIKRGISTAGSLEFRITANEYDHKDWIERAVKSPAKEVKEGDAVVARWVKLDPKISGIERFTTRENVRGEVEVLVVIDTHNVTGDYLVTATSGFDKALRPNVIFSFNTQGSAKFAQFTTENQPNTTTGFKRTLGIVLDDVLLSAPGLNEPITGGRGEISGGGFTQKEVDFIISILNAGSLPAALNKVPISEVSTSPTLGADTVKMGARAIALSMAAVLVFMLIYYRFAGVVACFALAANLVLILAVMISIKAAFTLPGIAGLVLTVGMAVDANVLIFERIHEELDRGAALRMAIRNGFNRAKRTIFDANLTTLITAIVLYWIGTDQLRGFAVTLILGILMSMYTAIFCSRIIFDISEKMGWIKQLRMTRIVSGTNIDFLGKRHVAAVASIALIAVGMVAVYGRGKHLLDIDFSGGSSVIAAFTEKQEFSDVRDRVKDAIGELQDKVKAAKDADSPSKDPLTDIATPIDYSVVGVGETGEQFKIDTSIRNFQIAQQMLIDEFGESLVRNRLEFTKPAAVPSDPAGETGEANGPQDSGPPRSTSELTFGQPIKEATVRELLDAAVAEANLGVVAVDLASNDPSYSPGSDVPIEGWTLNIGLVPEQAASVLGTLSGAIADEVVFPSSSNIGGKVAGDTQVRAGYALFTSLLFIVAYIWLRFQRIMYGLAAVVALLHDVLVTLGVLALSKYAVDFAEPIAGGLLIEPFKIGLPIVAALLTIIGYSLNDTIVVFDRIREVRGKSPDLTGGMINASINQTLSRTLLTSLTTLLVVVILYVGGGPGIHAFAFALVVGVLAGTYSSIFVASPVLLWMSQAQGPQKTHQRAVPERAAAG